jgi:hypothetical protein
MAAAADIFRQKGQRVQAFTGPAPFAFLSGVCQNKLADILLNLFGKVLQLAVAAAETGSGMFRAAALSSA